MSFWDKLKCCLGFHDWKYHKEFFGVDTYIAKRQYQECQRCKERRFDEFEPATKEEEMKLKKGEIEWTSTSCTSTSCTSKN